MVGEDAAAAVRPPGEGGDDVLSAVVAQDGEDDRPSWKPDFSGWHPVWGLFLGLLLVAGDALLWPGEAGLTVGGKLLFCMAAALAITAAVLTWVKDAHRTWRWYAVAAVAGIVVAAVSGDWFGGASEPPAWRDAVVPGFELALLATATVAWYAGRREGGEVLLVTAVTALGMVAYGQQDPMLWATITGVVATVLLLVPSVGPFARIVGLAIHALALLSLIQHQSAWFAWTPFPFLSLIPVYILVVYFRESGAARGFAWWTGAVVAVLLLGLGTSTLIGNLRRDLPVKESVVLQAMGLVLGLLVAALAWMRRRQAPVATPVPDA